MSNTISNLSKLIKRTESAFEDAKLYSKRERVHSAYIYLNSRIKKQAFNHVAKEIYIESIPTGLLIVNGDVFRIEPVFDNDGNYICEELLYLGARNNSGTISIGPISESSGIL